MNDIDVAKTYRALEESYSRLDDEELRDLAERAYELTDIAQQALQAQLSSRGLHIEIAKNSPGSPESADPEFGDLNPADLEGVTVAWSWNAEGAQPLQKALYEAGIPSYLEVRVREGEEAKAVRVIADFRRKQGDQTPEVDWSPPRCPECHSEDIVFDERVAGASASGSVAAKKFRWHCEACGHKWEDDGVEE